MLEYFYIAYVPGGKEFEVTKSEYLMIKKNQGFDDSLSNFETSFVKGRYVDVRPKQGSPIYNGTRTGRISSGENKKSSNDDSMNIIPVIVAAEVTAEILSGSDSSSDDSSSSSNDSDNDYTSGGGDFGGGGADSSF